MSKIKVTQADREAAARLIGGELGWYRRPAIQEGREDNSTFVQAFAAHRQAAMIEGARLMRGAAEAAFKRDAELCDCFAREEGECACGAWDGYKSIYVDRAVEIILALDPASIIGEET